MAHALLPAIWLIILIVGLPQLSETVYTPSLPEIAQALKASESMVEYTLTTYLFGFAIGTLFWGKLSDKVGRKPCVIAGLILFILGCVGCYLSTSIEMLMISRLIQAFGGSIGSVLGQAIARDAFHGPALSRAYASVGSALGLFPAIGPVMGGLIAERFDWPAIFIFLMMVAIILSVIVLLKLPETHHKSNRKKISLFQIGKQLVQDKKVIGYGLIVAGCNGILFSYFAEGSFYLIKMLGLSPSQYGVSFILIASATMMGGLFSRKLHTKHSSQDIMFYGIVLMGAATGLFSLFAIAHHLFILPNSLMIAITLSCQMITAFGICMGTSNALALALVDYKHAIGTASSIFGFFYYSVISAFTLGMGALHNGSLLPMPLYFLGICVFMIIVSKKKLCKGAK